MRKRLQRAVTGSAAVAMAGSMLSLAACGGATPASSTSVYHFWDPYPQYNASSPWAKLVQSCGKKAGVTVQRTASDTTQILSKALLAAQQHDSPDVVIIDNATVSTLAVSGAIVPNSVSGLSTKGVLKNLLSAGTVDGKTYGTMIGANATALYYNKTILKKAGVSPASITSWNALNTALAKVAAIKKQPISFSAVATEEGSFQFEPWFWGAGANLLKLGSPQAVAALTLWTDWLKKHWAPASELDNVQFVAFQQFLTGNVAFGQNGPWEVPFLQKTNIDYGIMPIPGEKSGIAPVPPGGEFIVQAVQTDTSRYKVSDKIIACLTKSSNLLQSDQALHYVAPTLADQKIQVAKDPAFKIWTDTVDNGKMRTGDGLGTKYPIISQQLWTAMQNSMSGTDSPSAALAQAQTAAAKGIANAKS